MGSSIQSPKRTPGPACREMDKTWSSPLRFQHAQRTRASTRRRVSSKTVNVTLNPTSLGVRAQGKEPQSLLGAAKSKALSL